MAGIGDTQDRYAARPESGLSDDDISPVWADDDRPRIPRVASEREALAAYLEYYRATVTMKCRGLSAQQLRAWAVPPASLSLHGLVRHLAGVERWWFQQTFARREVPLLYVGDADVEPPWARTSPPTWPGRGRSARRTGRLSRRTVWMSCAAVGLGRGGRPAVGDAADDLRVCPALRACRSAG